MPDSIKPAFDDMPTQEQIENSDVVATVFIEKRIARLRALCVVCGCPYNSNCAECDKRIFAITELSACL